MRGSKLRSTTASIEVTIASAATPDLVAAFARLLPQLSSSPAPPTAEALAEIIASPCTSVLVARDLASGSIVGTLALVLFRIPTGVRARIEDVVVDGTARGRGVGEALTRLAVEVAIGRGAKTVDLTSRRSREAAHRLYEKAGFSIRDTSVYRYVAKSPERRG